MEKDIALVNEQTDTPLSTAAMPMSSDLPAMEKDSDEKPSSSSDLDTSPSTPSPPSLSDQDRVSAILKRQIETPPRTYSFWHLYTYASNLDLFIIFVATIASCAAGAAMPGMTLIFGGMQGVFQDYLVTETLSRSEFQEQINSYALYFVYLGIGTLVTTYVSTVGFLYTGENLAINLRQAYLTSCLRQNMGFFDATSAGQVAARITSDANSIQDGISDKVSLFITALATLISSFIIAFTLSWKLTLIMSSVFVALLLSMLALGKVVNPFLQPLTMAIIQGSTLAHEAFSAIRVAIAFRSQDALVEKYDLSLKEAQKWGFKIKAAVAVMMAFFMGMSGVTYSLGFWQGSLFLVRGEISIEKMLTAIMVMLIGSMNVGYISPYVQAFKTALNTASNLMTVIDRKPTVDATDKMTGDHPQSCAGEVEFRDVSHIYPSRPEVQVLRCLNVNFRAGETTAIVGPSGSGKSTLFGLLSRWYKPVAGTISLDGRDITSLNLHWLRKQMGVVGQEPVLFAGTVYENIRNGLVGTTYEDAEESVQREMVIKAAKTSYAHDFITEQLVDGYDTDIGQRALLLSGGQKQRIAIARAIVSEPKILLLDEATSALDTRSEGAVQAALEKASVGRTTIIIAHRLSTIRNADTILVLTDGQLIEQGKHSELLDKRGAYHQLVIAQDLDHSGAEADSGPDVKDTDEEIQLMEHPISSSSSSSLGKRNQSTEEKRLNSHEMSSPSPIHAKSTPFTEVVTADGQISLGEEGNFGLWTLICFIFRFNKKETLHMSLACVFCVVAGLALPVQSVFFAKQLTTLSNANSPNHDPWEVRDQSNFWSAMLLMIGLVIFLAHSTQGLIFAHTAEVLTRRARRETVSQILHQDVSFFDQSKHSPGALGAFLALETAQLASMSGANLGNLVTSSSTIIGGAALALAIGWKLALVCLSVVPLLVACSVVRFFILKQYENRASRIYVQSAAYAAENIVAIRTVASLGLEGQVSAKYKSAMDEQRARSLRSISKSGVLFAISQSAILLCLGLAFWYGSTLIADGEYTMFQFFVCVMSVIFGTQSAGALLAFTPDVVKARHSAAKLKALFDAKPLIDTASLEGYLPGSTGSKQVQGSLVLDKVHFTYPSRPEKPVLRGINLTIQPGQHVALVGSSGCGKSTILGLLERFYDPQLGQILLDGTNIRDMPVQEYRSHVSLVSQEPTLFQWTIRENILIGCNSEVAGSVTVSDEDLERACRDANIWDFIISLPDGLDTNVGGTGALLSGGQKQRIAIARALVRRPKVLLLDEATSALDTESERVVQDALKRAAEGRTTVTVAHRLTTIIGADRIYMLDQGRVAEQGTHAELVALGGLYAKLAEMQSLGV